MRNINSIHDALSIFTIFLQTPIEPFDARLFIQQHIHFLVLVVTICSSLLQGVDEPLRHTIGFDAHEIVCRQSSLADKLRNTPRLHQDIKQIRESLTIQSARSSRQSQELSIRESLPHLLIGLGKRMVRLINHYHPRFFLYLVIVFRQPLYRHSLYRHHVRSRINRRGRSGTKPISTPLTQAVPKFLSRPQASSSKPISRPQARSSKAVPSRTIWRDL